MKPIAMELRKIYKKCSFNFPDVTAKSLLCYALYDSSSSFNSPRDCILVIAKVKKPRLE